jgi:hypothetical protein
MDQVRDLADNRLIRGCIYCGRADDTRDHVPARVFLDPPFPENLPVLPACRVCNNGFSIDEQYLACLIECARAGSTEPDRIQRPRIARLLQEVPALRARIEAAKMTVDGMIAFEGEEDRIRNVVRKLARGHAAFELSLVQRHEPVSLEWWPLSMMSAEQLDAYDAAHVVRLVGEIGSRGTQGLCVTQFIITNKRGEVSALNLVVNDWVTVQDGVYRYLATDDHGGVRVKIVIAEFFAGEIVWSEPSTVDSAGGE